jgi:hypothetical protein
MNIKEVIDEIAVITTLIKNTNDPIRKMMIESRELNPLLILYAKLALNLKLG